MPRLSAAELSDLIGSIYDRAIDPQAWGETLTRMRLALGGENAALSIVDLESGRFLLNVFDRIPEHIAADFDKWQHQIIELWGGASSILAQPMDEPAILSQVNPSGREGANAYRDAFAAQGFADAMTLGLARDDHVIGSCVFGRVRSAGRFREDDIALGRLLLPHAQRAIAFSRMLEMATLRASAFEAALEAVRLPTMLVTADLEVVHSNPAAHAEFERGELLRLARGRIATPDVREHRKLRAAVVAARDRPHAQSAELDVALGPEGRRLRLLPLPGGSIRGTLAPSAAAAMILAPGARAERASSEVAHTRLVERHDLTRAEAAVAIEIAKGDGRGAAAARLGLSENTVRTHLSSIFLKLGVNRQAQLARLVDDLAVSL